MKPFGPRARAYSLLIGAALVVSLFCLLYPIYVIRPFRPQGVRELAAALFVVRYRGVILGACTLLTVIASVRYWRAQSASRGRLAAAAGALAVCTVAALSRVNVYELMFHPAGAPSFVSAADCRLDRDEKVIAIRLNGAARAYPVRGLAYHHIVNDTLGGVPVVSTY